MTGLGFWLAAAAAFVYPSLYTGTDTGRTKVNPPGVRYRMNLAMATSAPWVDSNVWRYLRASSTKFLCDVRGKSVAVAMGEAFMTGADVALQVDDNQKADFAEMLDFLKNLPAGPQARWVNLRIKDDGSAIAGEVLNLLARRSIQFTVQPDGAQPVHAKVGNPYEHVQALREQIGDDARVVRLYGSELTFVRAFRQTSHVRLQLLNYGSRPVEHLRLRVKGAFSEKDIAIRLFRGRDAGIQELVRDGEFTEFTLTALPLFGIIDIQLQ